MATRQQQMRSYRRRRPAERVSPSGTRVVCLLRKATIAVAILGLAAGVGRLVTPWQIAVTVDVRLKPGSG